MDTRILASNPNISFATSTARVTPTPPSATKFGDVLASTAVSTAEQAITVLPGGPMMALALRNGAAAVPLGTSSAALTTGTTSLGTGLTGTSATSATGTTSSATGTTSATGAVDTTSGMDQSGIQSSLQQSADMNMYMLQVQQQVQQQGQQFSTLSNVMKAQYDTVKNAIGNIR